MKTCLSAIILLILSIYVSAQNTEPKGKLTFYHTETQVGTVAKREFTDSNGRIIKVIYYSNSFERAFERPFREESLVESSIQTFAYNDDGCVVKAEYYNPGMKLMSTDRRQCNAGTSIPNLTVRYDARGIKQIETRQNVSGGSGTVLHFDQEGKNVIAIRGVLPDDVDLVDGWGTPADGLVLGIAANRKSGPQKGLRVSTSIKNIGNTKSEYLMVSPVLAELRDSRGRLFKQLEPKQKPEIIRQIDGCPDYHLMNAGWQVGKAGHHINYTMDEQFDVLAAGRYSFRLTFCLQGSPEPLISNTIFFEIK